MPEHLGDTPRFFGRRHGRPLRVRAQALVDSLLPRLTLAQPAPGERLDPATLFAQSCRAFWLEVGFGGGEHLAAQAARHADVGFIGAEVFLNGVASLLGYVEDLALSNVRIFAEDIRLLLPALPDACLERVFVLFPDPWPKKRHAERRFVSSANLDQVSRLLVEGGRLRIATDDATYKAWALDQMAARADFVCRTVDPEAKPEDWPDTRYEMKARRAGRIPIFLEYERRPWS